MNKIISIIKTFAFAFILGLILSAVNTTTVFAIAENSDAGSVLPSTGQENDTSGSILGDTSPTNAPVDGTLPETGGVDDSVSGTLPGNGQDNGTDSGILPGTGGVNADTGSILPSTEPENSTDGLSTPPVVEEPKTDTGSHSSGGHGSSKVAALVATATSSANSNLNVLTCPLINSYMEIGKTNDPVEVYKLQIFLKNVEKMDVDVTGIYDKKTFDAVSAFQVKYADRILAPWGAELPSGYTYITTRIVINDIACKTKSVLTPEELAIINAYKLSQANGSEQEIVVNPEIGLAPSTGTTSSSTVGSNNTSQTASAGSIRDLGFFRWLIWFLINK